MTEYIYFVKCPNCDDEPFDFFDEAKAFALGCLSQKPIITQIEVCKNDFGECTDSCDLGTVWSWEDMMGDIPADKPAKCIFTKDDFAAYEGGYNPDNDPEFSSLDNSLDSVPDNFNPSLKEWVYHNSPQSNNATPPNSTAQSQPTASNSSPTSLHDLALLLNMPEVGRVDSVNVLRDTTGDNLSRIFIKVPFSRPAMSYANNFKYGAYFINTTSSTIDEIFAKTGIKLAVNRAWTYVNDSDVILINVTGFNFIISKQDLIDQISHVVSYISPMSKKPIPEGMTIDELVEALEENEDTVECKWCNELFDKSECRYEVNLGWLCSRCEAAIKSRGETLTFKENNYWDFLDEAIATQNSSMIGKYVQLVQNGSRYHEDGSLCTPSDLKRLLKTDPKRQLSDKSINFIAKFDNKCRIIQETDKAYLVVVPCYYRDQQDRSKLSEHPRYVHCWVPKVRTKLIDEEPEAIHDLGNEYDGGYPKDDII